MKSSMNVFFLIVFLNLSYSLNIQGQSSIWTNTFKLGEEILDATVQFDSKQNIFFYGDYYTYFIKKYTSEGKEIRSYELPDSMILYPPVMDKNENKYILISAYYDNYLCKLNSNNLLLWKKKIEGPSFGIYVTSIILNNNDVFLSGDNIVDDYERKAWVAKWDTSGNEIWQNTFSYGQWNKIYIRSSSVDHQGNFYIAGSVGWTMEDIFFAKFNNEGNILWNKRIDGPTGQHDQGWRIINDLDGNAIVLGTIDQPWVGYDRTCWVGKFNSTGNTIWTKTFFRKSSIMTLGLKVDKENSIYTAGSFYDGVGGYKPYLNKYSSDGSNAWIMDTTFYARIYAIDIDANNNIYFAGDSSNYFWIGKYGMTTTNVKDQSLTECCLLQNYPNPFNSITTIEYSISKPCFVSIRIFDMLGIEILNLVNNEEQPGKYEIKFDGSNLPGGIYLCQIKAGEFVQTSRLILMK